LTYEKRRGKTKENAKPVNAKATCVCREREKRADPHVKR